MNDLLRNFLILLRKHSQKGMKKETLASISQRTGYSVTTVSRVISGNASKYRIPKATADAIMEDAHRCNYTPSLVAKTLRTQKSNTIGLLLPSVSNPYFAEMASVVISEANRRDYTTIVVDAMEDEARMVESAKMLAARQVEGIIAAPCGTDPAVLERISAHVPVVLMDRFYSSTSLSYVTTNNYQGGLIGTRMLLESGHKRIVCIQGEADSMPNRERVHGYTDAMKSSGRQDYITVVGNEFSTQCGYLETKLLLHKEDRPTAIFALSNTILLGSLKAIRESGLKVPEDISIISFDNNPYMDYITPVVSRVSQPVEDMAKLSVKILFEKIEGSAEKQTQLRLSPSLITGESIAPVKD